MLALSVVAASVLVGLASLWTNGSVQAQTGRERSPGIDALLGGNGRAEHERRLREASIEGRSYPWLAYSEWGRELFLTGQVRQPPTGMQSEPLSYFYKCIDCHNNQREDLVLHQQDPEVRARMAESAKPAPHARPLFLATGTTLWGAVNRESFYNDSYAVYHFLEVPGGREMDPTSLEDATQVCCKYCSVGRFAETWEINALLAYFWDLEVRLADLRLPKMVENAVLDVLARPERSTKEHVGSMRDFLRGLYLRRAGDTYTAVPTEIEDSQTGPYADGLIFEGDPHRGRKLYSLACHHCHGENKINEIAGGDLVRELKRFHGILSKGTAHDDEPYMPMFTSQRLSRQQIADIQAYLLSSR